MIYVVLCKLLINIKQSNNVFYFKLFLKVCEYQGASRLESMSIILINKNLYSILFIEIYVFRKIYIFIEIG